MRNYFFFVQINVNLFGLCANNCESYIPLCKSLMLPIHGERRQPLAQLRNRWLQTSFWRSRLWFCQILARFLLVNLSTAEISKHSATFSISHDKANLHVPKIFAVVSRRITRTCFRVCKSLIYMQIFRKFKEVTTTA